MRNKSSVLWCVSQSEELSHKIGINIDINGSDSHKKVINEFKNIGKSNALWQGIGLDLDRLRIQRKKADYNDRYFTDIEKIVNYGMSWN